MKSEEIILMSSDETVDLILWQFEEIERLKRRVSELELLNNKPKKTSNNSSIPPSKDFEESKDPEKKARSKNHRNGGRELSDNPNKTFDFMTLTCIDCQSDKVFSKLLNSYDKLFLPEVKIETFRVSIKE